MGQLTGAIVLTGSAVLTGRTLLAAVLRPTCTCRIGRTVATRYVARPALGGTKPKLTLTHVSSLVTTAMCALGGLAETRCFVLSTAVGARVKLVPASVPTAVTQLLKDRRRLLSGRFVPQPVSTLRPRLPGLARLRAP